MKLKISVKIFAIMSLLVVLIAVGGIVKGCNPWLVLTLSLFTIMVCMFSNDFASHIFFLLFLSAFFVFLVGGQMVQDYFNIPMSRTYSESDYNYLNFAVFISLLFLLIGYIVGRPRRRRNEGNSWKIERSLEKNSDVIKRLAKISFFILMVPWFIILAEQCIVVQRSGYLDLYTFDSVFPSIFQDVADMCPFALCLFLATFPSKAEAKWPVRIVAAYAVISLLIGRRLYFVLYLLLLIGYCLMRTYSRYDDEIWISRRQILLGTILLPFVIIFLYAYKYLRFGNEVEAQTFLSAFGSFFSQQGYSANLIPLGKMNESQLGNDLYSFYSTIRFLRLNPITRYIIGINYTDYYRGSREHLALYSGSYARMISLITMRVAYLAGYGTGSCYVAELYHDFGYPGIVLGNLFYGFILGRVVRLSKNQIFKNMFALIIFQNLLMAPRYNFDNPFSFLLRVYFWSYVLIIYFVSTQIRKRQMIKESGQIVI